VNTKLDSIQPVSVHVSRPIIEGKFEVLIQAENIMREETDAASSIYPDDEATKLVPPAYELLNSIGPDHYLYTIQILEIKQEIADLWSELCPFDEDKEITIPPTTPSSTARTPSTPNPASISSAASTDETESSSSQRLSSNSSYRTAQTTLSSKTPTKSDIREQGDQRQPFTLNEMIELDKFCQRRQESLKNGCAWVDLLWGFDALQRLFLEKYGWMPYIERMEKFETERERDTNFWMLWDFPTNLV
jgi:hypothetical protein